MQMDDIILSMAIKYNGDFSSIYSALTRKEKFTEDEIQAYKSTLKCNYVTIFSENYPKAFKEINCPPFVLFYYGDLSLINRPSVSIVGTRVPSEQGIEATRCFTKDLVKQNQVIVSGFSQGVEKEAHETAIQCGGKTIAVLTSGIDFCFPTGNKVLYDEIKKNHLLISEYPNDLEPRSKYLVSKSRLVTGMSDKLLITECKDKSNSLIAAEFAFDQGKDIYCVPSDNMNLNINEQLMDMGTTIAVTVDDLFHNTLDNKIDNLLKDTNTYKYVSTEKETDFDK